MAEYLAEGAIAPIVMLRRGAGSSSTRPPTPTSSTTSATDPLERTNRAEDPAAADVLAELRAEVVATLGPRPHRPEVRASQRRRRTVVRGARPGTPDVLGLRPAVRRVAPLHPQPHGPRRPRGDWPATRCRRKGPHPRAPSLAVASHPETDVARAAVRRVRAAGVDAVAPAVALVAQVAAAAHDPRDTRSRPDGSTGAGSVGRSPARTSRSTTPTRCRSSRTARSRWRGSCRPDRSRPIRRRRCRAAGNVPGRRSSGARRSGSRSSPHGKWCPSSGPRAARSHSASVGSRSPAQSQYATASYQLTWTTGWVLAVVHRGLRALGVAPVGTGHLPPPRCGSDGPRRREVVGKQAGEDERGAELLGGGAVARVVDERGEVTVGDGVRPHAVRVELDAVGRPLTVFGVSTWVFGAHHEPARRDRRQGDLGGACPGAGCRGRGTFRLRRVSRRASRGAAGAHARECARYAGTARVSGPPVWAGTPP